MIFCVIARAMNLAMTDDQYYQRKTYLEKNRFHLNNRSHQTIFIEGNGNVGNRCVSLSLDSYSSSRSRYIEIGR